MKTTYATLAIAGLAAAAPHNSHRSLHEKKDLVGDLVNDVAGSMNKIMAAGNDFFTSLKTGDGIPILAAINSDKATSDSWVGEATKGDAVVNTIVNKSGKDAFWTCWGKDGSWVQKKKPTVSVAIPKGKNVTISHAISQDAAVGNSGACGVAFEGDKLSQWGQINNAWMEFTFGTSQWQSSTFDLSMEVNPKGHNMTIAGDNCVSDLTRCSFHCNDPSATSCMLAGSYSLKNCEAGSQKGANSFTGAFGAMEGGCQLGANKGIHKLTTTLHEI